MEVSFPAADKSFDLFGTFTLPSTDVADDDDENKNEEKKIPAILIVAGSGPIDRDGNARGIGPGGLVGAMDLNTSNRLAEFFDGRGRIAVLSYDKRGVGKSVKAGDKNLYHRAGVTDLVSDAVEGVRYLADHPRVDERSIALLGHSEGAILLPLICQKVTEVGLDPVKGGVFLAGFGESVLGASELQRKLVLDEVREEKGVKGWILRRAVTREKVEKQYKEFVEKIESDEDLEYVSSHFGLVKTPARWFQEHMAFDAQAALAEHATCHCLAVTGRKDVQVRGEFCDPDRAGALAPRAASIESHRPDNLTHILRSIDGPSRLLNVKQDYARMGKLPLDDGLLSIIGNWSDRILLGIESTDAVKS